MDLNQIISAALEEDIPNKDITTEGLNVHEHLGRARLIAKQDLTLSGEKAFTKTVLALDSEAQLNWHYHDGDQALAGQCLCSLQCDLIQLLKSERVSLNFLGHLSGIATLTHKFVSETKGTNCKILDTRKTTPLYRKLEKKSVRDGGGQNHRIDLSQAILVKENHICIAGSISQAVESIRKNGHLFIEVEVKNKHEAQEAIQCGAHRLLLDNMTLEEMEDIVKITPENVSLEASGNMTLDRIAAVSKTGVDYISVGALTHSAPCADISLLFEWNF